MLQLHWYASFKHRKCRDIAFCASAMYGTAVPKPITTSNEFTFIRRRWIWPLDNGAIACLITTSIPHLTPPRTMPILPCLPLPACVCRIVYLDSGIVLVDDFASITNEKCVKFNNKKRNKCIITVCYTSWRRRRLWWSITGYEGGTDGVEKRGVREVLYWWGSHWWSCTDEIEEMRTLSCITTYWYRVTPANLHH